MILEWIDYLCTPAPRWARERGLVYESIALKYRSRRQREAWAFHLQQCHSVIEKFIHGNPGARRIFVLGSGYLMEFPVQVLADLSVELVLIDAVHPRGLAKQIPASVKLKLLHLDLTLPSEQLLDQMGEHLTEKDLVISCNVMSQLAHSRWTGIADSDKALTESCVRAHLELLENCGASVLLISDFQKICHGDDDKILNWESTLGRVQLPHRKKDWTWKLAPRGEFSSTYSVDLQVGAWNLGHQTESCI